jgi:rubrerythrin
MPMSNISVKQAVSRITAEKSDAGIYTDLAYKLHNAGLMEDARLVMGIARDETRHHDIMLKVKADLERLKVRKLPS